MRTRQRFTDEDMVAAIERHRGSVAKAATDLGVTEQAVYQRLSDRGLVVEVAQVVVREKAAI